MGEPADGLGIFVSAFLWLLSSSLYTGAQLDRTTHASHSLPFLLVLRRTPITHLTTTTTTTTIHANSGDYMQGTSLKFRSKEDAIHFCQKQGWDYFVQEPHAPRIPPKSYAANYDWSVSPPPSRRSPITSRFSGLVANGCTHTPLISLSSTSTSFLHPLCY